MELELVTVVLAVSGAVLLYSSITDRNPIDVVKLALQGKGVSEARPISGPLGGGAAGPPDPNKEQEKPKLGDPGVGDERGADPGLVTVPGLPSQPGQPFNPFAPGTGRLPFPNPFGG